MLKEVKTRDGRPDPVVPPQNTRTSTLRDITANAIQTKGKSQKPQPEDHDSARQTLIRRSCGATLMQSSKSN